MNETITFEFNVSALSFSRILPLPEFGLPGLSFPARTQLISLLPFSLFVCFSHGLSIGNFEGKTAPRSPRHGVESLWKFPPMEWLSTRAPLTGGACAPKAAMEQPLFQVPFGLLGEGVALRWLGFWASPAGGGIRVVRGTLAINTQTRSWCPPLPRAASVPHAEGFGSAI